MGFEASADGLETISESFDIELSVPHAFPDRFPQAREAGGRIDTDYEHLNPDGTLCLAVPIEQRRLFLEQPTVLGFVNRLLVPYLYGYSFWRKHGYHPFGEAAHGSEGILRHYVDTLGLRDPVAALAVISFLFEHAIAVTTTVPVAVVSRSGCAMVQRCALFTTTIPPRSCVLSSRKSLGSVSPSS